MSSSSKPCDSFVDLFVTFVAFAFRYLGAFYALGSLRDFHRGHLSNIRKHLGLALS